MRRYDLDDQPPDDLTAYTSGADRLAMVWPLTVASWALAGRQLPDYERRRAPGTVRRSGDPD